MGTAALVSAEEYLATSYRPDCDYVDGVLLERNVGQNDHGNTQAEVVGWFRDRRRQLRMKAFPEQRVRIAPDRYRVPDVCVVKLPWIREQVLTVPPYICIEILSPDDSFPRMQDRFDDYLSMGVPNVRAIDPASRAWTIRREGHFEALEGVLRTSDGAVALKVADLFAEAD